ncbi:MAG TPA: Dabb family protein [Candidatus Sumerlaeota bacterium]|nr:Dabb family protein [Candidatus Sumerlaeota bacterium]HPS00877.1 Dabb family protein [Candidatus Sumerlaeota bacterium]
MLLHTVFFWLKEDLTDEQRAMFRKELEELSHIEAAEAVFIGTPAATEQRPVVDNSFAFNLTVFLRGVAGHDAYQSDPIHLKFIEKCASMWIRVQVYDAEH